MKQPQSTRVRAERILGKLNCFQKDEILKCDASYIRSIIIDNNKIDLYDDHIKLSDEIIHINKIKKAEIIEKDTLFAKNISLTMTDKIIYISISSKTNKYYDVFEVLRFFIRIIEDRDISSSSMPSD